MPETKTVNDEYHPIISVIIPVYNVAQYLDRCLTSVVKNDYCELQIICVNDGSTDESGEILKKWEQSDSRIQIITMENRGLSEARNTGIREATGAYIAFIDSDDWIHAQYFSTLLHGMMLHSADISVCGHVRVGNDHFKDQPVSSNITWNRFNTSQFSAIHNRGFAWGKLYKRQLAQPVFDRTMLRCEDIAYNMRLVFEHPEMIVSVTEEPLYYYFYRDGSLLNTSNGTEYKMLFEYFVRFADRCAENNKDDLQAIFVIESVKRALSYRYLLMFDCAHRMKARDVCNRARKLLSSAKGVSWKNKAIYTTFLLFPLTYRVFRIIDDPTMMSWERKQRKAARNR